MRNVMNLVNILEYLQARIDLLKKLFYGFLLLLVVFDVLLPREHAHFFVDKIPAFWTLFTVTGCFILARFSKGLAHTILGKKEDFYE
jgi:hypothetical protein